MLRILTPVALCSSTLALPLCAPAIAQGGPVPFRAARLLTDVRIAPGRAVAEFDAPNAQTPRIDIEFGPQNVLRLNDEGRDHDRRAGDGIFTGVVPVDLLREREIFRRVERDLRQDRPIPVFEGREFTRVARSGEFLVHATPGTLPILTTAARSAVQIENSISITDLSVIESPMHTFNPCTGVGNPNGVWTFGHVMTELAGALNPSDFVHAWLDEWTFDQNLNGFTAFERTTVRDQIISAWPTLGSGDLDMTRAPFRLTAIMNRVDLRGGTGGYGSSDAGEARLVYCFIDGSCNARRFLPIFEYQINRSGCDVKAWGEQWAALSDLALGSPAYLDALAAITSQFTDVTSNPTGNTLGQLRTNEFIAPGFDWELREFRMVSGILKQDTVKLTPDTGLNNLPVVGDVMNGSAPIAPIEGASAVTPFNMFWNAPNVIDNDDRHAMSLNTCSACHMRETNTFSFMHISHANFGVAPTLSGFLTGITVSDPVSGVPRTFDDLERRRQDLENLVNTSCLGLLLAEPMRATH